MKIPKILIIEDDQTMLSLLTTLLSIEGYETALIEDFSEDGIIQAIGDSQPDLILMDVNLRGISGLDLLRKVRSLEIYKNIRIMMSSGMDYRYECKQAGADGFILKPYMPEELVNEMKQLLRQSV